MNIFHILFSCVGIPFLILGFMFLYPIIGEDINQFSGQYFIGILFIIIGLLPVKVVYDATHTIKIPITEKTNGDAK